MHVTEGALVPDALASLAVLDAAGDGHALASHWAERDALFVFVRHFGCVACHEQLSLLRARASELDQLSLRAVVVGCAAHEEIAPWVAREGLEGAAITVRTDPSLSVHRALGLYRSAWRTWGPRAAARFLGAVGRGTFPGKFRGDVPQQGGALFVGRDRVVRALFKSEHLGDYVSITAMIDRALAARVSESSFRL